MKARDGLHYYVDLLPHDRGQMRADLVDDGKIVQSWNVGSPAPFKTVEKAAKEHNLYA